MASLTLFGKLRAAMNRNPFIRGMISYSILWPTSSVVQQLMEGKTLGTIDVKQCARLSIYGGLFVAPVLFGWVRLTSAMWVNTSLRAGLTKAILEQVSYGPFSVISFYIGMNLLEFKSFGEGLDECKVKFWPTWKTGACVWPIVQTINFSFVPEGNRVVVVSIASFIWTIYLAYMKQQDPETLKTKLSQNEKLTQ